LQLQHHGGQGVSFYLPPFTPVADFPVLTEKTIQVAVGEEDGPGTKIAYKLRFLSEMGMAAVEHGVGRGTAVPQFILKAVDVTFPGTKIAGSQPYFSFVSPLLQFTGRKFEIRRFIIHSCLSVKIFFVKSWKLKVLLFNLWKLFIKAIILQL
jgi:hypothetical protein